MNETFWQDEVARLSQAGDALEMLIQAIRGGQLPARLRGLQGSAGPYATAQIRSGASGR